MTGHRMVFSISPTQSVLWDQIQYSGSPEDFAWVLPVHAGARLELSHDEFFAALDAMTNPVITGPSTTSCGGGGGAGCASLAPQPLAPGSSDSVGGGGPGVQVISQGVVGPYDMVTLQATDPNALYNWLLVNKYDIPSSTRPIIDAYVSEKFDFIALRLAPGQGVQAMQPVRVITPGGSLSLPLRMVAAGVGANVGITLYVIGDGRYEAQNFPNGVVDDSQLVWLHATNASNYTTLTQQVMQGDGGRTWLTDYAGATALPGAPSAFAGSGGYSCGSPNTGPGVNYYGYSPTLGNLYYGQCFCKGPTRCSQSILRPELDASLDALLEGAAADAPCDGPMEASMDSAEPDAASADGSEDASDDGSATVEAGWGYEAGATNGADAACGGPPCDGFDDLAVASMGLDANNTWITRMRANLPSSALTDGDLVLEASSTQSGVSNRHTATVYDDPTYDPCPNRGGGCVAAADHPALTDRALVAGALAFLGTALARRRRSRGRREG